MQIKKTVLAIIIGSITLMAGCYYDKEEELYPNGQSCNSLVPKFSTDISPIFQTVCSSAGCHDAGSTNAGGPFTNYNQVKDKAIHIKEAVESRFMPQGTSLTNSQIKMISCWVTNGAPNN